MPSNVVVPVTVVTTTNKSILRQEDCKRIENTCLLCGIILLYTEELQISGTKTRQWVRKNKEKSGEKET